MTEPRNVVVDGFPVERLPRELREQLAGSAPVRVAIEQETASAAKPVTVKYGFARGMYAAQGIDPTEFIRQLRDEWD